MITVRSAVLIAFGKQLSDKEKTMEELHIMDKQTIYYDIKESEDSISDSQRKKVNIDR